MSTFETNLDLCVVRKKKLSLIFVLNVVFHTPFGLVFANGLGSQTLEAMMGKINFLHYWTQTKKGKNKVMV